MRSLRSCLVALFAFAAVAALIPSSHAAPADWTPVEQEVATLTQSESVTLVHFWASWCGNCKNEHAEGGWKKFLEANPGVTVIFVSVWGSAEDDRKMLEAYGLTSLPNFRLVRHPNQARKREEKMTHFLDTPVIWIPTTWVYRAGRQRYALNYGEVRFDLLTQLVADAGGKWPGAAKPAAPAASAAPAIAP